MSTLPHLLAQLAEQEAAHEAAEINIRTIKARIVLTQTKYKVGDSVSFEEMTGWGVERRKVTRTLKIDRIYVGDSGKLRLAGRRFRSTGELGVVIAFTDVEVE